MRSRSTWRVAALVGVILGWCAGSAWAGGVKCRAMCTDQAACKTSDLPAPAKGPWWIDNCEEASRKVEVGCAEFWYFSKRTPRPAKVCAGQLVAAALKEPDVSCALFWCLIPEAPKSVPGSHPIGPDEQSASSSGAKAGLPFGTVLMPVGDLTLASNGAAAGSVGMLSVTDVGSKRVVARVPIAAGSATIKQGVLSEASAYAYRWEAPPLVLEGSFKTAGKDAREDVESPGADPAAAERQQWQLIKAMAALGYRWDATQAARQLPSAAP